MTVVHVTLEVDKREDIPTNILPSTAQSSHFPEMGNERWNGLVSYNIQYTSISVYTSSSLLGCKPGSIQLHWFWFWFNSRRQSNGCTLRFRKQGLLVNLVLIPGLEGGAGHCVGVKTGRGVHLGFVIIFPLSLLEALIKANSDQNQFIKIFRFIT